MSVIRSKKKRLGNADVMQEIEKKLVEQGLRFLSDPAFVLEDVISRLNRKLTNHVAVPGGRVFLNRMQTDVPILRQLQGHSKWTNPQRAQMQSMAARWSVHSKTKGV